MKISKKGLEFIAKEEGLRLNAYKDSVGVWTIGYGSTYYEDGSKVEVGDIITKDRALSLFEKVVSSFADNVSANLRREVNQNQFDALVSLSYNIGKSAFNGSTVLKRVNLNPCDKTIKEAFEMWKNAGGKPILLNRRIREANLYFS